MAGFFTGRDSVPNTKLKGTLPQCGKCGLSKKCLSPRMPVSGKGKRKVLFVAEAPGESEDRQGIQLIGDAGKYLRKCLQAIDVDLDDCWKTNAVICRPPKNKIESYMISCCNPTLINTIQTLKPKVIIILGLSALKATIGNEWKKDLGTLKKWAGWNIPSTLFNSWLCPTYHPSYIIRMGEDKTLTKIFIAHLKQALALEHEKRNTPSVQDLENQN